ncbi:unnamed protein product [Victoria cruziana]
MLNLSNNTLQGVLPSSLASLALLQVLDLSRNGFVGQIPAGFAGLKSLNKFSLNTNALNGSIPAALGQCSALQMLDLSSNHLSGEIPAELCRIQPLDISLNLSNNQLSGRIPPEIAALTKLSVLDLSHNMLTGNLTALAALDNLVSLNISYNRLTGSLPNTKLFRQLSDSDLAGNDGLCTTCIAGEPAAPAFARAARVRLVLGVLASLLAALLVGILVAVRARRMVVRGSSAASSDLDDPETMLAWPWQFTPFQKLSFTVDEVVRCLVDGNVIGKGCSGVVYKADMGNGEVIAVKKLWPSSNDFTAGTTTNNKKNSIIVNGCVVNNRDSFSAEVKTLGSIRHKNIVRFLGCCWNKRTRLLMYDYLPNGSLGSLLHEKERTGLLLDWGVRYEIILGAAQGLAYLHHDCVPPIVHRDIKANNILIGTHFEPYIADFGLAKLIDDNDFARSSNTVAGSYGYIAPEYGYRMKITEKSDVYSYGVVVLEVLTGKQPIDPTIPEGLHVVDWVRQRRYSCEEVLDPQLRGRPDSETEEMIQAVGIALLCVNPCPEERPTMKDVAAMLKEIRHERDCEFANSKVDMLIKGPPTPDNQIREVVKPGAAAAACSQSNSNSSSSFSTPTLHYSSFVVSMKAAFR